MKLHHVGFVVKDIDTWEKNMIYETKLNMVYDPIQKARLALYSNYSNSMIELIQPMDELSFSWNSLKKMGNHFNHFCYEIESVSALKKIICEKRMILTLGPVPALLFNNEDVYFYFSKNLQLLEFLVH